MRLRFLPWVAALILMTLLAMPLAAQLRITLPKRSKPTPVQKLNQQGVYAVQDRDFEAAKKLFYKAYLLDPNDPFTLNNLGYIAELEGQVERAQRFYALSKEHASDATVAASTTSSLKGKSVADVAGKAEDAKLLVNQYNLEAIGLLMKDRAPEADLVLKKALEIAPQNPFTLNNLGFAKEKQGELEQALSLYLKASSLRSREPVIVTPKKNWRGKAISEVAEDNAGKLRKLMRDSETPEARVTRWNLQGVSAINRNEPQMAREYFERAYGLNPTNAFTLNNMGYLAELEGDRESAEFYYAKAREANGQDNRVDVSTRADMEGKRLRDLASHGESQVLARIESERRARAERGGPTVLRRRDGSVVVEPELPPEPVPALQPRPQPEIRPEAQPDARPEAQPEAQPELMMPLPESQQPAQPQQNQPPPEPEGGLMMPLPEDQQPPDAQPTPAQPETGPNDGGLLMPLPEEQQPPAARQP